MRKTWLIIGGIVVVGILLVAYVIPSGIKGDEPQADISIFIEDLGTGDSASALVTVGEPSNPMSFVKDSSPFKPLASYQGDQTVTVYVSHTYAIWASVTFRYSGERIASYSVAYAQFVGRLQDMRDPIEMTMTHRAMVNAWQGLTLQGSILDESSNLRINVTANAVTSPMTLSMTHGFSISAALGDWRYVAPMGSAAWTGSSLFGSDLNGAQVKCWVTVMGVANDGSAVKATVDAVLTIHANYTPEGGSISVSVDSMSAGVS